ncbi:MAG: hypothetical protein JW709_11245 [Sedimentisphaerales bacterium]|nr:hypothetical protein [Sedimentisphaerales bacterium]
MMTNTPITDLVPAQAQTLITDEQREQLVAMAETGLHVLVQGFVRKEIKRNGQGELSWQRELYVPPDMEAIKYILEHLAGDRWRRVVTARSATAGGAPDDLTDDQLRDFARSVFGQGADGGDGEPAVPATAPPDAQPQPQPAKTIPEPVPGGPGDSVCDVFLDLQSQTPGQPEEPAVHPVDRAAKSHSPDCSEHQRG